MRHTNPPVRWILGLVLLWQLAGAAHGDDRWTPVRRPGFCAFRGEARRGSDKKSAPLISNVPAQGLPMDTISGVCGSAYAGVPVCCDSVQASNLAFKLGALKSIVNPSCPACFHNLAQITCAFTCSPDQSTFADITEAVWDPASATNTVGNVSLYIEASSARAAYQSCENSTSTALGARIMDALFHASDYEGLLYFLGHNADNPMTMDFVTSPPANASMAPFATAHVPCDTDDTALQCAVAQCQGFTGTLSPLSDGECRVGALSCFMFGCIIAYISMLALVGLALSFRPVLRRSSRVLSGIPILLRGSSLFVARGLRRRRQRSAAASAENAESPPPENGSEDSPLLGPQAPIFGASGNRSDEPANEDSSDAEAEHDRAVGRKGAAQPREFALYTALQCFFYDLGHTCASQPLKVIALSALLIFSFSLGWLRIQFETEPINLWVSPSARSLQQKHYFDANFGPFYRISQVFLTRTDPEQYLLSEEHVHYAARLQQQIVVQGLNEVCFQPLKNTSDAKRLACAMPSPLSWFDNYVGFVNGSSTIISPLVATQAQIDARVSDCVKSPIMCLPDFKQPVDPDAVLGGLDRRTNDLRTATSMIFTFVGDNHLEKSAVAGAMAWERKFVALMRNQTALGALPSGLRLSYSTESAIEEEINAETSENARTIIISYLVMFAYVSIALGRLRLRQPRSWIVNSRVALAIGGIIIVISSAVVAVGIFALAGAKISLIIAEVIPFLALAIGVDNIFIIVHKFETTAPEQAVEERVARTMGDMGPSILLSSVAETLAFTVAAFVGMPAVATFASHAALTIFVGFVLQITLFSSLLALDARRAQDGRVDCLPFLRLAPSAADAAHAAEGPLQHLVARYYARALLHPFVKAAVLAIFAASFIASTFLAPGVDIGLDQRMAVPRSSYLVDYFDTMERELKVGPPVYFVVQGADVTALSMQRRLCSRHIGCDGDNVQSLLTAEARRPNTSFLATPPDGLLDDFFSFMLYDDTGECCGVEADGTFRTGEDAMGLDACSDTQTSRDISHMRQGAAFTELYAFWRTVPLQENVCIFTGIPAYEHSATPSAEGNSSSIGAFTFRAAHTVLRSHRDFVGAYRSALAIADKMAATLNARPDSAALADAPVTVFPYSVFYVFFEQYLDLWRVSLSLLAVALAAVLVVCWVLLGSVRNAALVLTTVVMMLTSLLAAMRGWGIALNGVSLVNLVIAVGLGVEFCTHVTRAFNCTAGTSAQARAAGLFGRTARAYEALVEVFSGITVTKLLGIAVLGWAPSLIFEVYYYRMYLCIVALGFLHGLVFLPVLLSVAGSRSVLKVKEWSDASGAQM